jgi:tetratricopeptide (TPR) repeat protein
MPLELLSTRVAVQKGIYQSVLALAGTAAVTGSVLVALGIQKQIALGIAGVAGVTAGVAWKRKGMEGGDAADAYHEATEGEKLYELASTEFEEGNYRVAIGLLDRVIELDGESAIIHNLRGYAWGELGEWENQIRDYSRAMEIGGVEDDLYLSRGLAYYNANSYEDAIEDFSTSIESRPENRFAAFMNRGSAWFCLQKYEVAISDYSTAISMQSDNADLYYNRARAHQEKGNHTEAIEDLSNAVALGGDVVSYLMDRAISWVNLGENLKAIEDYSDVLEYDDQHYDAYWLRGRLKRDMGRLEEAVDDFKKAIEINPEAVDALRDRGFTHGKAGDYELAINDYTTAIEISPEYCGSYYCRAIWKRKNKDIEGALEDLDLSTSIDPEYPNPYQERASIYLEQGKHDQVLTELQRCTAYRDLCTGLLYQFSEAEEIGRNIERLTGNENTEELREEFSTIVDKVIGELEIWVSLGDLLCRYALSQDQFNKTAALVHLRILRSSGDVDTAISKGVEYKKLFGLGGTLSYLLGIGGLQAGIRFLEDELLENPQDGELCFRLGHLYLQAENDTKAIEMMTRAIELGIHGELLQKAYGNRCNAYLCLGMHQECIADIDMFLAMSHFEPSKEAKAKLFKDRSTCNHMLGDLTGALEDAETTVELARNEVNLNNLGNMQQEAGLLDEAITSFTEAIALAPQDAFILTNRANTKNLKGDIEGALNDYTEAIERGDLTALFNRGNLKSNRLKDYDGAIADFTNAINCDSCTDKHYYYYNRAFAKHLKEDLAGTLEDCDLAHGVDPNYIKPIRLKAKTHFQLGELPQAKEWYLKILDRKGEDFYDWNELGTIENNLDNHELAVGCLRQSIKINLGDEQDPSDSDALAKSSYHLSHSFYRLGEYQDAVAVALECEQYCELNAEYLRVLACVYDEMGDSTMALETINRAITLDDSSAEIWYDRGVIRRDIGDLEGALDDFKKAIAINALFTSAYHNIGSIAWCDLGNREMGCSYWKKAADLGDEDSKDLYTKNCVTPGVSDAFPGISDL